MRSPCGAAIPACSSGAQCRIVARQDAHREIGQHGKLVLHDNAMSLPSSIEPSSQRMADESVAMDCHLLVETIGSTILSTMSEVTRLLGAAASGDRQAAADLLPLVYDEL